MVRHIITQLLITKVVTSKTQIITTHNLHLYNPLCLLDIILQEAFLLQHLLR